MVNPKQNVMERIQQRLITRMLSVAAALWLTGCHSDMYDQPRKEPLEASEFFDDGRASRPLVAGTIARGQLYEVESYTTGKHNGQLIEDLPEGVELSMELLRSGQQRFNIFCINCHGAVGEGDGMIVQRGYRRPPTYHSDRLRGMPIGHFFDVMTNGFGVMPDYAEQVRVKDRWAIAAYIRVLQQSQYYRTYELPPADTPQRKNSEVQ
jgi:mono/diheme cytochrome c family protein